MLPELAAARAVSRALWSDALDLTGVPDWFAGGLIEYTARRAVAPLFQATNLSPGYAMLETRHFGGFVPRFVRIRLLPEADGEPVLAYRARPRVNPTSPSTRDDVRSLTGKTVLLFNTLERWIGQPVFDGVLAEFVRSQHGGHPKLDDFARVASASSGQDLSWLLNQTLAGSVVFDYGVEDFSSSPAAGGGYETTVVVARLADGLFTGASAPPVGPYAEREGSRHRHHV